MKGTLFMFGDLHPEVQQIELFKQAADLTDDAIRALTDSHDHLL